MAEKKLSEAAMEALQMIAVQPRKTTKAGYGEYISGRSAQGLIERGLAHRIRVSNEYGATDWLIEITDAGRKALKNGVNPS